LLDFGLGSGM